MNNFKSREKIIVIIAIALIVFVSAAIVFGGIYFGLVGFFSLIGVTYDSTGSLLLFILYCILIGIFFEVVEVGILFFIEKAKLDDKMRLFWKVLVKLGLTWFVIHIVNELMTTITLSAIAEILTALLIVCVDIVFDDDKKTN